ncbi:ABC transporter permease [Rhodococcus sp. BP-252]|uniref:ABC transporter permease n=1 Tax=Rhodococcoides kyotonense TaxID=398843 RepID=A0A177YDI6_9NOCA|nr:MULTISPECIES: ABC transporter permease [Rhodococcus]MBY6414615.1 ABC transporter permease [Rhodococcus sp. BP-320]MBY6419372.1 ABC transporter permease [Rhodococcus sp. BP-321]MBY6424418.1 ABC transporter permease [Rhodococcus sp. BP-324]MBY6429451.1 ABC transporter permease [Rhodococcus sp. BP-323]MBY6434427.1 ABC transporter permease [Rhodococcus sp. BP-322]MBY6443309.1 ABC transporter permease [Rhodococcus sp. BP-319]MBY6448132.1 ABC transporter permease [Rhodococcus sp. BP-318]MBY645
MAVTTSVEIRSAEPTASHPAPTHHRRSLKSTVPSFRNTWSGLWRPLALVAVLIAAWWAVTESELVAPYILPSPADTWNTMLENASYLAGHTWVTTYETVAGFVIAALVGEAVAVLMIYSSSLEKTMYPLILFAQVIPKIAIAPLFVVWLGFGASPKILVAVLMAFFPIVIAGMAGLRSVDPEILELTSTMGASRWKTFAKVRFPASLPQLMSGLKIAATLAVTGAVVGEFVGANEGLGYVILQANGNIDTAMLFAALIIMSALGIILFMIIEIAEKFLIPWHASRRSTASAAAV